jgi:hypothetical protein
LGHMGAWSSDRRVPGLGPVLVTAAAIIGLVACAASAPTDLPSEKQAQESMALAQRSSGPVADKSTDPGRPVDGQVDPPPAVGLLGQVNAPLSSLEFTPTTAWAGWIDPTTYVQVFAGDSPAGGGLMFVLRRTGHGGHLDPESSPTGSFIKPPQPGGPLTLVRVEGTKLIVANQHGLEFSFDPVSATFDEPGT